MSITQTVIENQDDLLTTSRNKSLSPSHFHINDNHRSLDSISSNSSSRPKLHTIHSSDTSRFPTLEKLENSMILSKNSKITIEPVTFPADCTNSNMAKSNQVCSHFFFETFLKKNLIKCFMFNRVM
jgi:hypothetical protein